MLDIILTPCGTVWTNWLSRITVAAYGDELKVDSNDNLHKFLSQLQDTVTLEIQNIYFISRMGLFSGYSTDWDVSEYSSTLTLFQVSSIVA